MCMSLNAALHMAAANGHVDVIRLLLDKGAVRMNYVSFDVIFCISNGTCVKLSKSDPRRCLQSVDIANTEGNIPLHWACINGQKEAVCVLMENLSNASKLNEHERTPVDEALGRGFQDIVDIIDSFQDDDDKQEVDDVPEDNVENIEDVDDQTEAL